ncbi:hypothetical protein JYU34_007533 [Plutella xylostella]|uniref:FP protein C-terminal domain-containing protein n=1 Tax=Plutella xylostella TaxID=51655 RepID=A0ABQ7QQM0_PLUXY|nr:hypothetical protein JYU34_007533 [Plutella xylostella]
MNVSMDRSLSDPNLNLGGDSNTTPPSFISQRYKRKRDNDIDEQLNTFKEEMKQMLQSMMISQANEINKITPTLKEIQLTNINIENSISFLTSQNEDFKRKIEQYEIQAKKDREYIALLEEKVEDMQRGSRKMNFEIKNVPKTSNETKESLVNMVINLSKAIEYNLEKTDITDIYRVRSNNKDGKNNTPIVVETSSTFIKNDIIKLSKAYNVKRKDKLCARHLGFTKNEDTPVYVSKQLTAKGSRLYFLARDLSKSKGYKFTWTSYGRVYVRKDENSHIIPIKSEAQVQHLMCAA